jgi:putative pyruvate formate lyase activating enzyme
MRYPELSECRICPRECGVDRYQSLGFCGASNELTVNLAQLHFGEEPPISGSRGSGTIFFSHCNLKCVYCQNYTISCDGWGDALSEQALAEMMLDLQQQGAHNINLVTPSHYSPQIRCSLQLAKESGLSIPIVWNSNAYEKPEVLASLEGLVDIWLPDWKYYHGVYAKKYSMAADYPQVALTAIKEMYRQAGALSTDESGLARKGLLLRLLVLPNGLSGTSDILRQLAYELGTDIPLSLMAQYYPAGKATDYAELSRGINMNEYQKVLDTASELGFTSIYMQELSCSDEWTPRFKNTET